MEESRKRGRSKKDATTPHTPSGRQFRIQCPICRFPFSEREYEAHYQWERRRLSSFEHLSDLEEEPIVKGKREAAVAARKHLAKGRRKRNSIDDLDVEEDQKALLTIRRNRTSRNQGDQVTKQPGTTRHRTTSATDDVQTCFICAETLTGLSLEEVNLHIDRCLVGKEHSNVNHTQSSATSPHTPLLASAIEEDDYEEYTWAGQTRIRAASMLEGGFTAQGHTVNRNHRGSEDIEDDLNIDDDDAEEFGSPQYRDKDIHRSYSGSESEEYDQAAHDSEETETDDEIGEDAIRERRDDESRAPANQKEKLDGSGTTGLVLESLRARIKQLESLNASAPRCLICLDPYKIPVTSIVCWHTHCEACWMRSLGAKKVCPQCQVITKSADLRRVYL